MVLSVFAVIQQLDYFCCQFPTLQAFAIVIPCEIVIGILAFCIADGISAVADYIVDFIKFCAVSNVYFNTQGVLLKAIKTNVVHMLYLESGGHAMRIAGVEVGGAAAGDNTTEILGFA